MPKQRQQSERYASDGCMFPIDVLSRVEAAGYRRRLEHMEAEVNGQDVRLSLRGLRALPAAIEAILSSARSRRSGRPSG